MRALLVTEIKKVEFLVIGLNEVAFSVAFVAVVNFDPDEAVLVVNDTFKEHSWVKLMKVKVEMLYNRKKIGCIISLSFFFKLNSVPELYLNIKIYSIQ